MEKKDQESDVDKLKKELEPNIYDHAHTGIKAIVSAIPIIGGSGAEIFASVVTPPIEKRRNNAIIMIYEAFEELNKKITDFNFDDLSKNEMFITTVMHASQIAIRNHQKEKLNALKNAILNSALNNVSPEEDLQLILLDLIDSCTKLHLEFLKFFSEHKSPEFVEKLKLNIKEIKIDEEDGYYLVFDIGELIEYQYPELKGKNHIYEHILKDLQSKELMIYYEFRIEPDGKMDSLMMPMGEMLLSFITSPLND